LAHSNELTVTEFSAIAEALQENKKEGIDVDEAAAAN
jgi:hypothetical protein